MALAAEFEGTVWLLGGPIFMTIALSVTIGIAFASIRMALCPPLTTAGLRYMAEGQRVAQRLLSLSCGQDPQTRDPTNVSDPFQWRSSVTALHQVTILKPKWRSTQ